MAILSALDLSPVSADGGTQALGVRDTIEVAKAAERLGYHRFWVAEHHSIQHLSSPAPEILIAALTQVTSRIRDVFSTDIPLAAIFDHPTITELTQFIADEILREVESMSDDEVIESLGIRLRDERPGKEGVSL